MYLRKLLYLVLMCLSMMFFVSCGSAPGGSSSSSGTTGTKVIGTSSIFSDKLSVISNDIDNATITLLVTDSNGAPYDNLTFNVSTTLGVISSSKVTTDSNGLARINFYAPRNTQNGTAIVTFTNSQFTKTITIDITGNKMTLTSDKQSAKIGEYIGLSILLVNALDQPLMNQKVVLTASTGKIVCGTKEGTNIEVFTNSSGKVDDCKITSNIVSNVNLKINSVGIENNKTFYFNNKTFEFLSPMAYSKVDYTLITDITFKYLDENGNPTNEKVTFSTNKGEISNDNVTFGNNIEVSPDANGHYKLYLRSFSPGEVTIKAKKGTDEKLVIFNLISKNPVSKIILNASTNVLPISSSSQLNYTEITATVLDAKNFPIAGKGVSMSIINSGGSNGYLSDSSMVTDLDGKITFKYYAGNTPSSYNGVQIRVSSDSVMKDISLTVNQYATYISIGKGNTIEVDGEKYKKKFDILVTDISGAPIQNAPVTLAIIPLVYNDNSTGDYNTSWKINEDINMNGILDLGEDLNLNGKLDPGNVVTLDKQTILTDSTGFASFYIVYSKCYATWVKVRIKASTIVNGTESQAYYDHLLTYIDGDQFIPCESPFAP